MSTSSRFEDFQAKKDELIHQRIEKILAKKREFEMLTKDQRSRYLTLANRKIAQFQLSTEDFQRTIVHVDMDAFFASVETLECPIYHQLPMAVGSNQMLSTANYEARKYGVRSAMPGYIALRLCPQLIIVPVDYAKYRRCSERIQTIFAQYDPNYSMAGLDEAYLDITECLRRSSPAVDRQQVVAEMRGRIFEQFGLTASAGIACNSLLAKICSEMRKPNGQFCLPNELNAIREFIWSLPTRKVPGIGRSTEKILNALNIQTCDDLYGKRDEILFLFGECTADYLLRCSIGSSSPNYFGNNAAATERDEHGKSISTEFTFPAISSDEEMTEKCKELAKRLAEEVESKSLEGFTVTLKLKSVDFEVRTRSKTLLLPTSAEGTLLDTAMELLRKEPNPNIRLMGLRLSNLRSKVVSGNGDRSLASTRPLEYYGFAKLTTPKRTNPASAAVQCPVCNQPLSEDNFEQNEHLDLCLNRSLIG